MGGMDLRWVSRWCQSRGTSASGHSPVWAKEHTSARVVTLEEYSQKNSLTVSLLNRLRLRMSFSLSARWETGTPPLSRHLSIDLTALSSPLVLYKPLA